MIRHLILEPEELAEVRRGGECAFPTPHKARGLGLTRLGQQYRPLVVSHSVDSALLPGADQRPPCPIEIHSKRRILPALPDGIDRAAIGDSVERSLRRC